MRRSAKLVSCLAFVGLTAVTQAREAQEEVTTYVPGVDLRVFDIGLEMSSMPELIERQTPNVNTLEPRIDFTSFGISDRFYAEVRARLLAPVTGHYMFRLISDDGSMLWLDGKKLIDHNGLHPARPKDGSVELEEGHHDLLIQHFENTHNQALRLEWQKPGDAEFALVPPEAFSTPAGVVRVTSPGLKRIPMPLGVYPSPGDIKPLDAVHPSYDLMTVRPDDFKPKVGGMDLRRDGKLAISCWEPDGGVYLLDGIHGDNRSAITVKRIAAGLAEPLGLKVLPGSNGKDRLFVLQKQELTELIDHDGDEVIDEYRTVCNAWPVSANFHEFAFGLAERGGKLYATLAIAINPGGASTRPQKPERGRVIEIDPDTGGYRFIGYGLRTPNGIGVGIDGELFIADNQGDWLPASKLLRLEEDAFWNSRAALPADWVERPVNPPVLWLPQNEIGNSPSQPAAFPDHSPHPGQMFHGEVTHGGLKRDFIERINGVYQGCVFRFTQGLEAGINRVVIAPNGDIFVGGVGGPGNWSHNNKRFGLQRLRYNGKTAFEMKAVRAMANGFEIEFTRPLREGIGWDPGGYFVQSWRYEPTASYGGPKRDERRMTIHSASVREDRQRVFLEIDGLEPGRVVYLRLNKEDLFSEADEVLWSTEAWYTLNEVPSDRPGEVRSAPAGAVFGKNHTPLNDEQRQDGWRSLFDGRTTEGWRGYNRDSFPDRGWVIEDGTLHHLARAGGGDIMTTEAFTDFELSLEWKIARDGNSGIFYRVQETPGKPVWDTGPEMQVLDDDGHPDGANPKTSAGALYGLIAANDKKQLAPVGEWNQVRLVARGTRFEHWLNGELIVSYDTSTPEFAALVADSKFRDMPRFAKQASGHIVLQDHGDSVWYRNIRIRVLE